MPKFFFGLSEHTTPIQRKEVLLVTEYVGKEIARDEHDVLLIVENDKKEKVNPTSEARIRKAAVQSLESLHENGIMHGDIALRNLRI